ncbi:MAG: head-tail connector protein [Oceanibaculum nanhaiense]|uniref:head-tail connector protein n=1 Tax=Oceanibaculum nanhaiense TaxID=1909734 RepID=UPI0032EE55C7
MSLIRVTAPEQLPVSLEEAKEYLRVDHDDDDQGILTMIRAATERLDGTAGLPGLCLITQVWELRRDRLPPVLSLPLPPCQSVDEVHYLDPDGVQHLLAPDAYEATGLGDIAPARLAPARGLSWPAMAAHPESVTIRFTAGFGDDPEDVPEAIRMAILRQVSLMYDVRDGSPPDDGDGLDAYRQWAF